MNRSYYVIMVPVLLVAVGYILVFRQMGIAPGYPRLIVAMTVFFGAIWWLGRKAGRKAGSSPQV
jgi:ABC-type spermidine/putrescine transport system permease subunit II